MKEQSKYKGFLEGFKWYHTRLVNIDENTIFIYKFISKKRITKKRLERLIFDSGVKNVIDTIHRWSWGKNKPGEDLVKEIENTNEAWNIILRAELQRTDLIQMIGDLQEKLKTAPGRVLDLDEDEKE